jgi:hypothetical protein
MSETPDMNDWLENMLQTPAKHIDDDGFTARVITTLPARSSPRARLLILGLCTVLAGVVLLTSSAGPDVTAAFESLLHWRQQGPGLPVAGAVLAALIVWGAWGLATAEDS